jgi:hypothetical protein
VGLGTEKKRDERAGGEERDRRDRKWVLGSWEREEKLQVADRRTGHGRMREVSSRWPEHERKGEGEKGIAGAARFGPCGWCRWLASEGVHTRGRIDVREKEREREGKKEKKRGKGTKKKVGMMFRIIKMRGRRDVRERERERERERKGGRYGEGGGVRQVGQVGQVGTDIKKNQG